MYSYVCLVVFPIKASATCDFIYYISMFISTVALLCYGILYFDTVCQVTSYISLQVLIQVLFILLLLVTFLH